MKTKKFFIGILCCVGVVWNSAAQQIEWIYSTDSERWQHERNITISEAKNDVKYDVLITKYKEQIIDGFGGCFNELGWYALNLLDPDVKTQVLNALFDPTTGVGFSYCRTTIGGNDFSRDWYSLNETEGDFKMKNFSIKREKEALIPYIKSAMEINPNLKLWACPWSPPTWMKTNKHYATISGDHNDLKKENQVVEGDHFIQKKKYLNAYALYLSKYIDAYDKEGIHISMLQFQNEPYSRQQWPTCLWTPEAMRNFIANYLGPLFSKKHADVELWLGTLNCNRMEDVNYIMNDSIVRKYVRGIGLQWEGKDIIAEIHRKYKKMRLMQTENECGGGSFDWEAAEHTFDLIRKYIGNGANSYMYWNMVLQDKGTSTWGWNQNAMIVIDSKTKHVNYTPEFYVMKHLSHFVKQGAYKMKTMGLDENMLSFKNPDGETIIFIANKKDSIHQMTIVLNGKVLHLSLKPKSFNTLAVKPIIQ